MTGKQDTVKNPRRAYGEQAGCDRETDAARPLSIVWGGSLQPGLRAEASAILRSLIEAVRLIPVDGKLEIELAGDLAGILALTNESPRRLGRGLQETLVAGRGFEPLTFRL